MKEEYYLCLSRIELINLVYALNLAIGEHKKLIEKEDIDLDFAKLQLQELIGLRDRFDEYACELTLKK